MGHLTDTSSYCIIAKELKISQLTGRVPSLFSLGEEKTMHTGIAAVLDNISPICQAQGGCEGVCVI